MDVLYTYYCTKCKIKITHDELTYVECPKCKTGKHIRDHGDQESFDNITMGQGKFNWNKG